MVYLYTVLITRKDISGKENLKICHLIFNEESEKRVLAYVRVQCKHQDCTDMANNTHNGYSKGELTFLEEPPKLLELECPICLQVMLNDPHLVSCCGHHFCGPCIKEVQSRNEPCPLCKENSCQAMVDKKAQLQCNINGLHVCCIINKERGKWKGEFKDLSFQ